MIFRKIKWKFITILYILFYPLIQEGKLFISKGFSTRGKISILVHKDGILKIGNDVFINRGSTITCIENITIGDDVIIGENVKLYDHNHIFKNKSMIISEQGLNSAPINIEDNVWIGSNVVILKGVTIGYGSVVGAGVIVQKDIPPFSIVKNSSELKLTSY